MIFKATSRSEGSTSCEASKARRAAIAIDSAPEFDADAVESAILDVISHGNVCMRGRCKRMSRIMMI